MKKNIVMRSMLLVITLTVTSQSIEAFGWNWNHGLTNKVSTLFATIKQETWEKRPVPTMIIGGLSIAALVGGWIGLKWWENKKKLECINQIILETEVSDPKTDAVCKGLEENDDRQLIEKLPEIYDSEVENNKIAYIPGDIDDSQEFPNYKVHDEVHDKDLPKIPTTNSLNLVEKKQIFISNKQKEQNLEMLQNMRKDFAASSKSFIEKYLSSPLSNMELVYSVLLEQKPEDIEKFYQNLDTNHKILLNVQDLPGLYMTLYKKALLRPNNATLAKKWGVTWQNSINIGLNTADKKIEAFANTVIDLQADNITQKILDLRQGFTDILSDQSTNTEEKIKAWEEKKQDLKQSIFDAQTAQKNVKGLKTSIMKSRLDTSNFMDKSVFGTKNKKFKLEGTFKKTYETIENVIEISAENIPTPPPNDLVFKDKKLEEPKNTTTAASSVSKKIVPANSKKSFDLLEEIRKGIQLKKVIKKENNNKAAVSNKDLEMFNLMNKYKKSSSESESDSNDDEFNNSLKKSVLKKSMLKKSTIKNSGTKNNSVIKILGEKLEEAKNIVTENVQENNQPIKLAANANDFLQQLAKRRKAIDNSDYYENSSDSNSDEDSKNFDPDDNNADNKVKKLSKSRINRVGKQLGEGTEK